MISFTVAAAIYCFANVKAPGCPGANNSTARHELIAQYDLVHGRSDTTPVQERSNVLNTIFGIQPSPSWDDSTTDDRFVLVTSGSDMEIVKLSCAEGKSVSEAISHSSIAHVGP